MPKGNPIKSYLAFDIGAESGRAFRARLDGGILRTEEIHRFPNRPLERAGSLRWDVSTLWAEMRKALAIAGTSKLEAIGVDTWGVDYALLDEHGELLEDPYHYRDARTNGAMDEVFKVVSKDDIYAITGIQFMPINTLYQLVAAKKVSSQALSAAACLITIPDLFHYWLTGNAVCEFTNATTTQMVNSATRLWATDLMDRLSLPSRLPAPIVEPGSVIGSLLPEGSEGTALAGTPIIAPASHDTGSAVAAISAREGTAFVSSGTWSLVGTELDAPVLSSEAMRLNFSNEGGVNGTTRLLKNVMGLWMLRRCRDSWAEQRTESDYAALMELAEGEAAFQCLVDPDDESFLRPNDMCQAIDDFCLRTQQAPPPRPGAYVRTILESLAMKYREVIRDLEHVTGEPIEQVRVVGGGSKNRLLNQFTADATGRRVMAGPVEATALGNIAVQILATGEAASLREARAIIDRSFPTEIFEPLETDKWERQAERFQHYHEITYA